MANDDLRAVAFPKLNEDQMAALGRCPHTTLKRYRDGEKLFETGDREFKCLLIATGADYRRLSAQGCEQFEGCGVYYAATMNEAMVCQGAPGARAYLGWATRGKAIRA